MTTTPPIPTAAIILAAGKGTRMKSSLPKVMHPVAHEPMLGHVLHTAKEAGLSPIVVVISEAMESVEPFITSHGAKVVYQREQLGTGHAVLCAKDALHGFEGNITVLYGDTPLITPQTILNLQECLLADAHTAVAVLGFEPDDAASYGRLVVNSERLLERIVEARDATDDELDIGLCNSGVIALRGNVVWDVLAKIGNENAKGEYYLTDAVAIANASGMRARVVMADAEEVIGVNSRTELAEVEAIFQDRMRIALMESGVTMQDPTTVYFAADTQIAPDCIIEPNVVFGPGVAIGTGSVIRAFSHIEGTVIGEHAAIGPFARLRPGNNFADHVKIGNFVEVKKSELESGAKINHLSYIGDASVGEKANIGAGTITCNYDGYKKYRTVIGREAFIGSNSALVAPVVVGEGAMVGAGSVITEDVAPDSLALARTRQEHKDTWAKSFRDKQAKK